MLDGGCSRAFQLSAIALVMFMGGAGAGAFRWALRMAAARTRKILLFALAGRRK